MVLSRPSVSVTSWMVLAGASSRSVARKPISRSSSPRNDELLRVTSTPPLALRLHSLTRYAAVHPPPVVQAHVGDPAAEGEIGDERDHGDAVVETRASTASPTRGSSGAFRMTPSRPTTCDGGEGADRALGVALLAELEAGAEGRRPQRRAARARALTAWPSRTGPGSASPGPPGTSGRTGAPASAAGPGRRSPARPGHGRRADPGSAVQHPVDGRPAEPGLGGDVADPVRTPCRASGGTLLVGRS